MFHVPAHKNTKHPAAQIAHEPKKRPPLFAPIACAIATLVIVTCAIVGAAALVHQFF